MDNNASEIRIGHATYLVEREFVGNVSREELIVNKIVDHHTSGKDENKYRDATHSKRKG